MTLSLRIGDVTQLAEVPLLPPSFVTPDEAAALHTAAGNQGPQPPGPRPPDEIVYAIVPALGDCPLSSFPDFPLVRPTDPGAKLSFDQRLRLPLTTATRDLFLGTFPVRLDALG